MKKFTGNKNLARLLNLALTIINGLIAFGMIKWKNDDIGSYKETDYTFLTDSWFPSSGEYITNVKYHDILTAPWSIVWMIFMGIVFLFVLVASVLLLFKNTKWGNSKSSLMEFMEYAPLGLDILLAVFTLLFMWAYDTYFLMLLSVVVWGVVAFYARAFLWMMINENDKTEESSVS